MKGFAILIVVLLVGGLLITLGQTGFSGGNITSTLLGLWSMWQMKVALASVMILAIWLIPRGNSSESSTTTTSTSPTTKKSTKPDPLTAIGFVLQLAVSIVIAGAVVWLVWHYVVLGIPASFGSNHPWVQSVPVVKVVNNGFHRHDAQFPKVIEPDAFDKTVVPDRVYNAFKVKKGDFIEISFDRPIFIQIKGPGSTGWSLLKTPMRFSTNNAGLIQIKSETGSNHIRVAPST